MVRTGLFLAVVPLGIAIQQPGAPVVFVPSQVGVAHAELVPNNRSTSRVPPSLHYHLAASPAPDSARTPKLVRYTLTGLAVGAVAGAVGGAVGSRYAGCSCSQAAKIAGFSLWFGAIGAGAGAAIGATIGIIHDRWP